MASANFQGVFKIDFSLYSKVSKWDISGFSLALFIVDNELLSTDEVNIVDQNSES